MSESDLHVVILAAGKGTRMKSARPKVLHHVAGRAMIDHVLAAALSLAPRTTTVVVGHMKEALRQGLGRYPDLRFVDQPTALRCGDRPLHWDRCGRLWLCDRCGASLTYRAWMCGRTLDCGADRLRRPGPLAQRPLRHWKPYS
jgi:hypothetical protein